MSRNQRIIATAVGGLLTILLLAFLLTRPAEGVIARGVVIGDLPVAGLTQQQATEVIVAREDALAALPVVALVGTTERTVLPDQLGFSFSTEMLVHQALLVGRDGSTLAQFGSWIKGLFGGHSIELRASLDETSVEAVLDGWDAEAAAQSDQADITVEEGMLVPTYASPTTVIIRSGASEALLGGVLDVDRSLVTLGTETENVGVPDAAVDEALAIALQLLDGPITLSMAEPPATLRLTASELTDAFITNIDGLTITPSLDPILLETRFAELREAFAQTFKNAELVVSEDDTVSIIPGETGLRVDSDRIIEAILTAAQTPDRSGQLPVIEDAEPDVTVADLEALKIEHVVSSFTTYHDCCQNRVINIHLMADTINGTIVMPGELFSVNDTVGERTQEKGYLPAGTIVNGELEDTFGGGVSQFATTMYNTVFWGGYTDVTHKPHSLYFSRYPEGIEATLDFPSIDLAFRNQTAGALYIKTEYTDTSLTIKILGSNGGRTVAGEQRNGSTNLTVVSEGDPSTAVRVSATVSDRYGFTSPDTVYLANPEIEPGTSETTQSGLDGWSVTVTRVLTQPDGTTTSQEWVARYRSRPVIIEVHPCDIPKGQDGYTGNPCPTTTTSIPDETTTTTVAPTATTAP